jgi:molecular chaperone DnaK (HSP70)
MCRRHGGQTSCAIENVDGQQTTLSAVAFTETVKHIAVLPAKRQAGANSANNAFTFEHLIGG